MIFINVVFVLIFIPIYRRFNIDMQDSRVQNSNINNILHEITRLNNLQRTLGGSIANVTNTIERVVNEINQATNERSRFCKGQRSSDAGGRAAGVVGAEGQH